MKSRKIVIGTVVALLLIVVGSWVAWDAYHYESTDDAFIDAHIIPIAPKVSGQVVKVYVNDNQAVNAGEPLVDIDDADYKAKLEEARARLASAKAAVETASSDVRRYKQLLANDEISQQQMDQAATADQQARADVQRYQAAAQQAELNLAYTHITAPESGMVARKSVENGMYVQIGQPLLSVVPNQVWVTANFKETQLTHMRAGQPVRIKVDAFPNMRLTGHVDSIQSGTGERFSIMPPENATGNYVKVVQRVPVKIVIDDPDQSPGKLSPGMSVEPVVQIR